MGWCKDWAVFLWPKVINGLEIKVTYSLGQLDELYKNGRG